MKLLVLLLVLTTFAQNPPPRAIAKFCGNAVVRVGKQQQALAESIHAEGCQEVIFVPLDDHYVLGYGVTIYIGE